jgi:FkbM family methyltransferase
MPRLRKLVELASRDVILKRRLPSEFGGGVIFVSPGAALNYWRFDLGKIDPMLLAIVSEIVRKGDVVWDVGANVGLFSFAAAALAGKEGRVVAIEPDTWLAGLLRRSAARVSVSSAAVDVLPAAVSDRVGVAALKIALRGRASNHLASAPGSTQAGGFRDIQFVPTFTLDALLEDFSAPKFVKIDVEGAENRVIRGASKMLNEARPVIACEVFEENRDEVDRLLKGAGYTLHDADLPKERRTALDVSVTNTLAYPPGWSG